MLVYPDVRAAVEWLEGAFGFGERVRIGDAHRAQLRVGSDGSIVVADVHGEQVAPAAGAITHLIKVRVPDVDAAFTRPRGRGDPATLIRFACAPTSDGARGRDTRRARRRRRFACTRRRDHRGAACSAGVGENVAGRREAERGISLARAERANAVGLRADVVCADQEQRPACAGANPDDRRDPRERDEKSSHASVVAERSGSREAGRRIFTTSLPGVEDDLLHTVPEQLATELSQSFLTFDDSREVEPRECARLA